MTVLCFGTFDGLHAGHVDYFRQARTFGDRLVVVVALDETVKLVKDQTSVYVQQTRLQTVADHLLVDEARLGSADDRYRVIEDVRPDIIVLGYDQVTFTEGLGEALRARGLACKIVRAAAYQPEIYKSSKLYARSSFYP